MRLLVSRPEAEAMRTADKLRALGHDVIAAPLLRIMPVDVTIDATSWAGVLITSANAARAVALNRSVPGLARLPVFAVGRRSAEAARAAGFTDVISADGALPDLVQLVAARLGASGGRVIYLAGEERAGDPGADLAAHGISVETAVVYRAVAADELARDVVDALREHRIDAVLHYSHRSAAILVRLADSAGVLNVLLNLEHYCLSSEIAAALGGASRIRVAPQPNEDVLLGLLGST